LVRIRAAQTFIYLTSIGLAVGAYAASVNEAPLPFGAILDRITPTEVAGLAILAALVASALAYWVLDAMPHMHDAFHYIMEARILMSGHLGLDRPLYPELFAPFFQISPDLIYVKYPPG
jgi:hypothetical protein